MGGVRNSRESVAQKAPPPDIDLRDFPARPLRAGEHWWRQHRATLGPWWFSCEGTGRFDLRPPRGTCYLASTASATIRERLGADLVAHRLVPASLLAGRVVSKLTLRHDVRAANLDAAAAAWFGVTRELAVMVPYTVPRAWANALASSGFEAVLANLRFSPGRARGLALFDEAGEHESWAVDPRPAKAIDVATRMRLRVVETPSIGELTIVEPS